jgi:hypothetical protein
MNTNTQTQNKFSQLCVWPGTVLGDSTPSDLEQFFLEEMNARIKYHCSVTTLPDLDKNGRPDFSTGGRNDLFFYVHEDDVAHFAVPRLKMGIRWWEDVVGYNDNSHLYTPEFIAAHPLTW